MKKYSISLDIREIQMKIHTNRLKLKRPTTQNVDEVVEQPDFFFKKLRYNIHTYHTLHSLQVYN